MSAAEYDGLIIETNGTFSEVLTYLDPSAVPINLTGFTCKCQIKDGALLILDLSPYITLGGSAGTITFLVPFSVTSLLPVGVYSYDLVLISGSNHDPIIRGQISIVAGISS